jgi:hypothetical protein
LLKLFGADVMDNVQLLAAKEWESYSPRDTMSVMIADLADRLGDYLKILQRNPQNIHFLQDLVNYTKATTEE